MFEHVLFLSVYLFSIGIYGFDHKPKHGYNSNMSLY
jgi:NADH:ubiquinone oxidoreductase subunit K